MAHDDALLAVRPGMPQTEKDRLGLALLQARERSTWAADGELDGMTREELLAEAGKRRVALTDKAAKTKSSLLAAVRAVDPDAKGKATADAQAVAEASKTTGPRDQGQPEDGPNQPTADVDRAPDAHPVDESEPGRQAHEQTDDQDEGE